MNSPLLVSRRTCLSALAAAPLFGAAPRLFAADAISASAPPKRVAAICTKYARGLHADVLVGKVLEGWRQDGGPGPNLELVAMYLDQTEPGDLGQQMAAKHGVPIFPTIEQTLTVGGNEIAVDGVLSIGEHGSYPYNEKGQHLYPRRRFFTEITAAFEKYGQVVPVFSDKHLGPQWEDAWWIYQRARELQVPLMAGSSLPLSYRDPDVSLPMNDPIEAAVGIGYSGLDIYGIHTLELYQTFVERRRGAETGVEWVQCVQGDAIWEKAEEAGISEPVLQAGLKAVMAPPDGDVKSVRGNDVALFLFQYRDGFPGAVFMLPGFARACGIAVQQTAPRRIVATRAEERTEPRHPHFAFLLHAVERMFHTGTPSYPVERTLLTSGLLDRLLTSRFEGGKRLETPELAIAYQPVDYPHAPNPPLPIEVGS
jgi:hypothetical protein